MPTPSPHGRVHGVPRQPFPTAKAGWTPTACYLSYRDRSRLHETMRFTARSSILRLAGGKTDKPQPTNQGLGGRERLAGVWEA